MGGRRRQEYEKWNKYLIFKSKFYFNGKLARRGVWKPFFSTCAHSALAE